MARAATTTGCRSRSMSATRSPSICVADGHRGAPVRAVFVTALAPYRAMGSARSAASCPGAAERAGLGAVGAHRLRHTAATELLRAGASLPEVGQVLRHRRLFSTAIYAKVDDRSLRQLARPWPTRERS